MENPRLLVGLVPSGDGEDAVHYGELELARQDVAHLLMGMAVEGGTVVPDSKRGPQIINAPPWAGIVPYTPSPTCRSPASALR